MKHLALLLIAAATLSAQTTVVGGSGGGSGDVTTTGTQTLTNKTIDGENNTVQLRRAATDCTAETGGKEGEMCLELDADTLYTCQPTAGDCDTAGEWIVATGGSGAPTDATYWMSSASAGTSAEVVVTNESTLESAVGSINLLVSTELDTFSELNSLVADQTLVHSGSNIATATALATNGANCSAGQFAAGVDASGAAEGCTLAVDFTSAQTLENKVLNAPVVADDTGFGRPIPNDTSTGTTVNHLAKIQDDGANAEEAVISTTSDVDKIAGVVMAGAGTSGNATVVYFGEAQLDMDNGCTVGNWVIASTSVNGEGSCTGTKPTTAVQILGIATQTTGGAGLADVWLFGYASDNTGSGVTNGDSHDHNGGDGAQIPTGGIVDGAVTVEKLENDAKTYHDCQTLVDFGTAIPDTADVPSLWGEFPFAMTLTKVWCEVDANSASINLQRDDGTAANILSASLVCDTNEQDSCASGCDVNTIQGTEDDIAVGEQIDFVVASVSGALNRINVCISGVIQ